MVVAHNLQGMNAQRQFGLVTSDRNKSMEKLSSGYKINRAADDAAGLSISEKMRSQIRGLTQASSNSSDGISFIQIADGALNEVHDMLDRMVELTVKSSNGTNTTADREAIQKEITQLTSEINRVHETSEFNTIRTFTENGHSPDDTIDIEGTSDSDIKSSTYDVKDILSKINEYIGVGDTTGPKEPTGTSGVDATGYTGNLATLANNTKDAAAYAANKLQEAYPSLFSGASKGVKIGVDLHGESEGGVLAMATVSYYIGANGEHNPPFTYSMFVDTKDYDPDTVGSWTTQEKGDFAATVAHEMTHLLMDDATSSGMMGTFPKWFVEGMAQTASGDNGWVSSQIGPASSQAAKKNYMSQITTMEYGAGYMGVMTLGLEIQKSQTGNENLPATKENILAGLNSLFNEMASQQKTQTDGKGIDADAALRKVSKGEYSTFSDYVNKFKNGNSGTYKSFDDILTARGTTGAGSLLAASLSTTEADAFGSFPAGQTNAYYSLDPSYKGYKNSFSSKGLTPVKMAGGGNGGGGRYDDGKDLFLQVGAAKGQEIKLMRFDMSADAIFGGKTVDASTEDGAKESIQVVNDAIARVSKVRSYYGAIQNRLEHTIKNLDNVVENTTAAESQIRDTDMASEMVNLTKNNILMQAGQSMMAQANQSTQGVLSLLQ